MSSLCRLYVVFKSSLCRLYVVYMSSCSLKGTTRLKLANCWYIFPSIVVMIPACHSGGRGSSPCWGQKPQCRYGQTQNSKFKLKSNQTNLFQVQDKSNACFVHSKCGKGFCNRQDTNLRESDSQPEALTIRPQLLTDFEHGSVLLICVSQKPQCRYGSIERKCPISSQTNNIYSIFHQSGHDRLVVMIPACHAGGLGSIPCQGSTNFWQKLILN